MTCKPLQVFATAQTDSRNFRLEERRACWVFGVEGEYDSYYPYILVTVYAYFNSTCRKEEAAHTLSKDLCSTIMAFLKCRSSMGKFPFFDRCFGGSLCNSFFSRRVISSETFRQRVNSSSARGFKSLLDVLLLSEEKEEESERSSQDIIFGVVVLTLLYFFVSCGTGNGS